MRHESLNKQGITLLKKNQLNEAKLFFKKAIELKSDFSDAINNLGLLEHKLGKLDQAVRLYKKVVSIDSNYALESENKILSVIYFFSQGNIQEALETLNMLVEINPTELCNRTCSFCPRHNPEIYPNRNLHMSLDTVSVLVEQLKAANYSGEINITGFGEPFLNKQIGFLDIGKTIESVLDAVPTTNLDTLASVVENDRISRQVAKSVIESRA